MRRRTIIRQTVATVVLIASVPLRADLNEGLIAHWTFDDGTATDISGNGHHGTVYGATLVPESECLCGGCLYFDGIDDYVVIPYDPAFNTGGAITIVVWFRTSYPNGHDSFVFRGEFGVNWDVPGADHSWLAYASGGTDLYVRMEAYLKNEQDVYATSPGGQNDNVGHLMVGTFDRSLISEHIKLYLDDDPVRVGNADDDINPTEKDLYIGVDIWGLDEPGYHGFLDEIRIYDRAIESDEIDQLYSIPCCLASSPAEAEILDLESDPISQKIRYLSFSAGDVDMSQAVRVTFHNLPNPYADWNGVQLYVQEPQRYCENAGQGLVPDPSTPPGYGCGSSGGLDPVWFWSAELGCDPYLTDWTSYDVVHIFDEGIIPDGQYDVQLVEASCTGLSDWESDPSIWSPAVRWTQSTWADLVQDCTTAPCGPPNWSGTGIVDVTAILDKWKNLPGNVTKARADIEGSPAGDHRLPDQAINITDVTYCLGAFLGEPYPPPGFPPPSSPPTCP